MKTVTYSVSDTDIQKIQSIQASYVQSHNIDYQTCPERYGHRPIDELKTLWHHNGGVEGIYHVLKNDGLAHITKEHDPYYTFADHKGDCFDPTVNTDIDPDQLKREERRERARFNRQGAWFHTLEVEGTEVDDCAIGGFVGNDIFGSGYDTEFYEAAIEALKLTHPKYIKTLLYAAGLN